MGWNNISKKKLQKLSNITELTLGDIYAEEEIPNDELLKICNALNLEPSGVSENYTMHLARLQDMVEHGEL